MTEISEWSGEHNVLLGEIKNPNPPPKKMVTLKSQMFFQKENSSYDERVVEDECAVAWDEESHVLFYMQNNTSLT